MAFNPRYDPLIEAVQAATNAGLLPCTYFHDLWGSSLDSFYVTFQPDLYALQATL